MTHGVIRGAVPALLASIAFLAYAPPGQAMPEDEYFVYSKFYPPGNDLVWGAGGYVEDYGDPDTWGDEIQYIYFIQKSGGTRTAYKVKTWMTNEGSPDDPTSFIDRRQHPDHYDPDHIGPIEPRHFEIVSSIDITAYSDSGGSASGGFYADSSGVYYGAYPAGIHKWDHDWNYLGQVGPVAPIGAQSLAYDTTTDRWYVGTGDRRIHELKDTNDDGDLMDESWVHIFTHGNYAGSHHDGLECVSGFMWISDMTSDKIAKWEHDLSTDTWTEIGVFTYNEPAVVEGMGFGPNDHFWIGGYNSAYMYELGDKTTQYDPVADAGDDVLSHPPLIPVPFDASGSHHQNPERKIATYEWDYLGNGDFSPPSTSPYSEYAYPAVYNPDGTIDWLQTPKVYTAVLRVTDDDPVAKKSDYDTRKIHITAPPFKPVADAVAGDNNSYDTRINQPLELDGSDSYHPAELMYDPGDPWYDVITNWRWDLDDDGEFDDAEGEKVTVEWDTEGTYFITLQVQDMYPSNGADFGPLDFDEDKTTVIVGAIHDVAVADIVPSTFVATAGDIVEIDLTVLNQGDYVESSAVTLSFDGNQIGVQDVSNLGVGETLPLVFLWDTTGVSEGAYIVEACVGPVPGEINTADNCLQTIVEVREVYIDCFEVQAFRLNDYLLAILTDGSIHASPELNPSEEGFTIRITDTSDGEVFEFIVPIGAMVRATWTDNLMYEYQSPFGIEPSWRFRIDVTARRWYFDVSSGVDLTDMIGPDFEVAIIGTISGEASEVVPTTPTGWRWRTYVADNPTGCWTIAGPGIKH